MKLQYIESTRASHDVMFCEKPTHGHDCYNRYSTLTSKQLELVEYNGHRVVPIEPCDGTMEPYLISWEHVTMWRPR